jgi:hypothetical protein
MKREATFLSEPRDESRRKRWIPCQQARSGFYAGQRSRTVASEFLEDREAERRRSGLGNILKSPSCASIADFFSQCPTCRHGTHSHAKASLASGSFACEGRKREHARLSPFRSSLDRSAYGQTLFDGKLIFGPPVNDFADRGLRLIGRRWRASVATDPRWSRHVTSTQSPNRSQSFKYSHPVQRSPSKYTILYGTS